MTLAGILAKTEKMVSDNTPSILTAIGVTGTLTTAYLTGKASFKAAEILENEKLSRGIKKTDAEGNPLGPLDTKGSVELVWKLYVPAVGTAVLTVACIIAANRIGTRRAAAMAAAYSITQEAFDEYKAKVVEKMGDKKEQAVREEIAQDRIDNNPVSANKLIITGAGDVLCFDEYSGRYFSSDMQSLRKAQNDINFEVLNSYYASLTDFYNMLELPRTSVSDDVGWNSDKGLELTITATVSEDEQPCLSVGFNIAPIRNYHRVH